MLAWLQVIVHHVGVDLIRRRERRVETTGLTDAIVNRLLEDPITAVDVEDYEALALSETLHPHWRRIWQLYRQGLSYRQIADQLELPLGTVKSGVHRVRKQLQQWCATR
jgi:RNA polymerase sigma factor (sigma-70 family)